MKFYKKLFLVLPFFMLTTLFLYGKKQNLSRSLEESPRVQKQVVTEKIERAPFIEETQLQVAAEKVESAPFVEETQLIAEKVERAPFIEETQMQVTAEKVECGSCIEETQIMKCCQGHTNCENDLPKTYNSPARIDVCDGWDTFVTGSFIYWEVITDQIDIGLAEFTTFTPREFEVIKFDTNYEPGFKIGAGSHLPFDDWDLYAQYTRLHERESTNYDPNGKIGFIFITWSFNGGSGVVGNPNGYNFVFLTGDIKASYKFDLDKIDLELARSYYVGKNLALRPFIGGSAHWLDQNYSLQLINIGTLRRNFYKNDSWAIGPRFGIGSNWIFYKGFRLFGSGAFSLLYADNDVSGNGEENTIIFNINKRGRNALRDVEELMIGLGWCSYFSCNKWHLDLSVAYEAQRYSSTNYMAQLAQMRSVNNAGFETSNLVKPGDSFLHGLTVSARIDF